MPRDSKLYLDDIEDAINKIEKYTKNISYEQFINNSLIIDGVIKNLLVIGEAVKHLPVALTKAEPSTEWNKIAGFRDVLIHGYFYFLLGASHQPAG